MHLNGLFFEAGPHRAERLFRTPVKLLAGVDEGTLVGAVAQKIRVENVVLGGAAAEDDYALRRRLEGLIVYAEDD